MGTNYYLHQNICPHCERPERVLHIGKSSGGWTFSFRGYRDEYEPVRVTTFADWKDLLKQPNSKIYDEYGQTETVEGFLELVKSKQTAKYNGSDLMIRANRGDREAQEACGPFWRDPDGKHWLDPEGHSFSEGEFC